MNGFKYSSRQSFSMLNWDPTTRQSRLTAFADYLDSVRPTKETTNLQERLRAAARANLADTHPDQVPLAREFFHLVGRGSYPVALPWKYYHDFLSVVNRIRVDLALSDEEEAVGIWGTLGKMRAFGNNLELILDLLPRLPPGPVRVLTAMSGIVHVRGLLNDVMRRAHQVLLYDPKRKDERVRPAHEAADEFLNLLWFPPIRNGPRVGLGTVRNAWTHGGAAVVGDSLHLVDEETGETQRSLSFRDLATYLTAGRYAWEAFLLHAMFTMSVAIPQRAPSERIP